MRRLRRIQNVHVQAPSKKPVAEHWNAAWDIYYLNLAHRQDRKNALVRELQEQGINVEKYVHRIEAVHGATLNLNTLRQNGTLSAPNLTRGEVGCYLSHLAAWTRFLSRKDQKYAVIFEDDVTFINDPFVARLESAIQSLESQNITFDILFLSRNYYGEKIHPGFWQGPTLAPDVYQPINIAGGAQSYVLSREGAQKLLDKAKPIHLPLDMMLFKYPNIKCLSVKTFLAKPRNLKDSETQKIR
jgi:glycosyl transferase, family 25